MDFRDIFTFALGFAMLVAIFWGMKPEHPGGLKRMPAPSEWLVGIAIAAAMAFIGGFVLRSLP